MSTAEPSSQVGEQLFRRLAAWGANLSEEHRAQVLELLRSHPALLLADQLHRIETGRSEAERRSNEAVTGLANAVIGLTTQHGDMRSLLDPLVLAQTRVEAARASELEDKAVWRSEARKVLIEVLRSKWSALLYAALGITLVMGLADKLGVLEALVRVLPLGGAGG